MGRAGSTGISTGFRKSLLRRQNRPHDRRLRRRGGYDIFSRLIAPYLAKTLGTTVVVENVPGAGGLLALNKLYIAPPDGLQISLSQGTMAAIAQLTGDHAARFDLARFTYLATVGAPPGLWLVGPDSPIREVRQAIDAKTKWRWASAGGTSGLGIGAAFTCEALKLDCHVVQGYKGSADAGLAVTRGEMDAVYVPELSANNFVKSKQNWALGHDLAHQVAVLSGPADHLRGHQIDPDGCGRWISSPTSRAPGAC